MEVILSIKFDGKNFKDGSKTVANYYNDKIYEGSSRSKTLIRIKDAQKVVDGNMNDATIAAAWFVFK